MAAVLLPVPTPARARARPFMLLGFVMAFLLCLDLRCEAASAFPPEVKTYSEKEAKKFIKNLNLEWAKKTNSYYLARWDYEGNMTAYNLAKKQKVALEVAKFQKQQRKEAVKYPREKFQDIDLKRQINMYCKLGVPGLPDDKYVKNVYAELSVAPRCHKTPCEHQDGLGAEEEMKHHLDCWLQRRYGYNTTMIFSELVSLVQDAAGMDNFTDYTAYMLRNYEQEEEALRARMQDLVQGVHPLYKALHAHCRHRLRKRYAAPSGGHVPEHLLDDPICKTDPIPRKPLDFPGALRAKGFTVRKLFGLPDEFFRSLNMSGVPDAGWEKSYLEARKNVTMSCKAVAQDFLDNKDYRIRACSKVCEKTVFSASKLVTEIMYSMEMRHQPSVYRQTMNDAFIEGIGGMVALSLVSPNFLRYQELLAGDESQEMDVNLLYMIARNTLLPAMRDYASDLWRLDAISGKISVDNYNCEWWKRRNEFEGVEPPFNRSSRDFDPASSQLLLRDPLGTPFKSMFGMVLAFQMHRTLCHLTGLFDPDDPARLPLHRCNLLGQPLVSERIKRMMQAGASKPWKEVLEQTIGQKELDASAVETYFAPLNTFLADWNIRRGETAGWGSSQKRCGLSRWELKEQDPTGAEAGYYSCPDGEGAEPPKPPPTTTTTTLAPSTALSPSPTAVVSDAEPGAPEAAPSATPAGGIFAGR